MTQHSDSIASEDHFVKLADGIASRFKAVAFDMDQCIVACHSRGRLRRDELDSFLAKISPDFIALVPLLVARNVKLSITTHSDEAEYTPSKPESTYIMGDELVRSVLVAAAPALQDRFEVVAYNPYVRHHLLLLLMPHMLAKKHHIREVRKHARGVHPSSPALTRVCSKGSAEVPPCGFRPSAPPRRRLLQHLGHRAWMHRRQGSSASTRGAPPHACPSALKEASARRPCDSASEHMR
jgi:hypothetical protein